jgi:hypothetical protein
MVVLAKISCCRPHVAYMLRRGTLRTSNEQRVQAVHNREAQVEPRQGFMVDDIHLITAPGILPASR